MDSSSVFVQTERAMRVCVCEFKPNIFFRSILWHLIHSIPFGLFNAVHFLSIYLQPPPQTLLHFKFTPLSRLDLLHRLSSSFHTHTHTHTHTQTFIESGLSSKSLFLESLILSRPALVEYILRCTLWTLSAWVAKVGCEQSKSFQQNWPTSSVEKKTNFSDRILIYILNPNVVKLILYKTKFQKRFTYKKNKFFVYFK